MKFDPEIDRYMYIIGWIAVALFGGYFLLAALTGFDLAKHLPPCAFHLLTGYYCPGCGGSRAVSALLHGHFLESIYYNAFIMYGLVFGGWFMISQTIQRLSRNRIKIGMHYRNLYLYIALAIIIVNCIVKNGFLMAGIRLMQ